MKTIQEFIAAHKGTLDEKWAAKYPHGLGFILTNRQGHVSYGWLIQRPTSHTNKFAPNLPRKGAYLGASFSGTKRKLFDNQHEWLCAINQCTSTTSS